MKLYVGNLPWTASDDDLRAFFSPVGNVISARVITDRETGRSRGFGFVEMDNSDANRAIAELNDKEMNGRRLRINEAQDRQPRPQQRDNKRW